MAMSTRCWTLFPAVNPDLFAGPVSPALPAGDGLVGQHGMKRNKKINADCYMFVYEFGCGSIISCAISNGTKKFW